MQAVRLGLLSALLACAAHAQDQCQKPPVSTEPPKDTLTDTRVLRRVWLALTGTTPKAASYEALVATPVEQRAAALDAEVDTLLASPQFYEQMVRFGHEWLAVPAYTKGALGDAYQGDMSGHLFKCAGTTAHPGALYSVGENASPGMQCDSTDAVTTAMRIMGLEFNEFFIPGGYGEVVGVRRG